MLATNINTLLSLLQIRLRYSLITSNKLKSYIVFIYNIPLTFMDLVKQHNNNTTNRYDFF